MHLMNEERWARAVSMTSVFFDSARTTSSTDTIGEYLPESNFNQLMK